MGPRSDPRSDPWIVSAGSEVDLPSVDPRATPLAPGNKATTQKAIPLLHERLADLQVRLRAESGRSLLVVLQAMDAGGKDGTIKNVFRGTNPQGVRVTAFRKPSEHELAHDFLWRVHAAAPAAGEIGIFNRSHYEDVVTVRVRKLVGEDVWRPRFDSITDFERHLDQSGTTIVKLFLHISKDEQAERLADRLRRPDKRWKHDPADLEDRELWDEFQEAYSEAIERTSIAPAPWRIIPADRKWYRDWAVLTVLVQTLEEMDPRYPEG